MINEIDLLRRQVATTNTLAKFRGKKFSFKDGIHCVSLAHFHLRKMGHNPPKMPPVKSEISAIRALKTNGWNSVMDMLDAHLERIPGASMVMGDLAAAPSEDGIGSVFICAGPRKVFGWREDEPKLVVLDVAVGQLIGSWRA